MKAYLIVTGVVFAAIVALHIAKAVAEGPGAPRHHSFILRDRFSRTRFHDLAITEGFVEGTNVVEFDVLNEFDKMALRVEWEGTARARLTR